MGSKHFSTAGAWPIAILFSPGIQSQLGLTYDETKHVGRVTVLQPKLSCRQQLGTGTLPYRVTSSHLPARKKGEITIPRYQITQPMLKRLVFPHGKIACKEIVTVSLAHQSPLP